MKLECKCYLFDRQITVNLHVRHISERKLCEVINHPENLRSLVRELLIRRLRTFIGSYQLEIVDVIPQSKRY